MISFVIGCSVTPSQVQLPTKGSIALLQGTRDGCVSAHSSRGNSLYRTFYSFEMKADLITDDEYFDSWYRGYIYCFHIINVRAFSAIDSDLEAPWKDFWGPNKPKIDFPFAQGVPVPWSNQGIKLFGESESSGGGVWWNNMFKGCKTIFC